MEHSIDREKVIAWLADEELYYRDHGDTHNSLMACDALALLKEQPEIVRCKDCKHRFDGCCYNNLNFGVYVANNWFCADGERKVKRK